VRITVVGLGKMGLPMAVQYAGKGHSVTGADVDPGVVRRVMDAVPPASAEDDLAQRLKTVVTSGALRATTEVAGAVAGSEAVVVLVPLYVDERGEPEFSTLDAATAAVGRGLRPGTLVCYETTVPVGTTRERLTPALELASGLVAGTDFHVAFSPERVFTGRVFADLARYPKLVGALDERGAGLATEFYRSVLDFEPRDDLPRDNGVWVLDSPEAAELAKLAETTYRDVNIALVNQFARYADRIGVDLRRVIEACNSQPFSHLHRPGIAVGGHCIPVYPRLYLCNDPHATVVAAARAANAAMPAHVVDLLAADFGDLAGARVAVLGVAYRGGVKETAFSGVFPTVTALRRAGALPLAHDPLFSDDELSALDLTAYHLGDPADAAIVQTDHGEYATLTPSDLPGVRAVVDGRGVLDPRAWREVTFSVLGARAAVAAGG
jgi:nucleotide sugar dehydrogenase